MVDSMSQDQRAKLLQFVTGTTKVPSGGFVSLVGSTGPRKFTICKANKGTQFLPIAHTCFNQIDLPPYTSKAQLERMLTLALNEGAENFYEK